MNTSLASSTVQAGELSYPFKSPPATGESLSIAPGVHWLRMPLPMSLDHINLWALEDDAGWTLVDTGMRTPETTAAWNTLFTGSLCGRTVKRVICTHMHPDHIGMAGWLTREFDCRLWITRLEYVTCRMLVADTSREAPTDALRFYRACGWDESAFEKYKTEFGRFGRVVYPLPDSYRRVLDGEALTIGNRTWHAVVGCGHSPEHLSLYCPELRLLISGDQVLPKITSNVSVFPTEPDADPLTDWLESLASIKQRVPDDVLVLPSHNLPFSGLWTRLEQLTQGHEQSLVRLTEALREPKRAIDVFALLFRRPIGPQQLTMATGESVAHLNCLVHRGLAVRQVDEAGLAWYRNAADGTFQTTPAP
jgi:glyoxylase-like metal-dependent hydrolase (beta-lactamase superfamily II)